MEDSLDTLKQEIVRELEDGGFATFHGEARGANEETAVFWDTDAYPDFRGFLRCAAKLGVALIVLHTRVFREDEIEDALQDLEESVIDGDEKEEMASSLREMNAFMGLVGAVDISFDYQGRTYFYYVESDWYREFLDVRDEIDVMTFGSSFNEEEPDDSMGGYFSKN
jgi:hypothetical protein